MLCQIILHSYILSGVQEHFLGYTNQNEVFQMCSLVKYKTTSTLNKQQEQKKIWKVQNSVFICN